MPYLIGTDEAGYGPNLGPLVVAGTVWRVPGGVQWEDLYQRVPCLRPAPGRQGGERSLVIGDSKTLYRSASGLGALERGVFAALNAVAAGVRIGPSTTWRTLLERCDGACAAPLTEIAWYADYERTLPLAISPQEAEESHCVLARALSDAQVELLDVAARLVFPEQFNEAVTACGSKGTALSQWTLHLVNQMMQPIEDAEIVVQCDKHGARNRYGALLQHVFPDNWIEIREESKRQSVYRWGPAARRVEIRFVAKGERFMPAALASMTAKYLREIAMLAFNEYWQRHVPGLKPTAGYPVDAQRFRRDIDARRRELGVSELMLWRQR